MRAIAGAIIIAAGAYLLVGAASTREYTGLLMFTGIVLMIIGIVQLCLPDSSPPPTKARGEGVKRE